MINQNERHKSSKEIYSHVSIYVKNKLCFAFLKEKINIADFFIINLNKRAQRALGRSPEEKVKGHRGFNNREPQGHNLNNFGRGPFDDVIY